jgi:hypothetical protein
MSSSRYEYKYYKYKAKFIEAKKIWDAMKIDVDMSGGMLMATDPNTSPRSELFNTSDWYELFKRQNATDKLFKRQIETDDLFDQYLHTAPVLIQDDNSEMDTGDAGNIFIARN